jgi:hypothetical protein
VVTGEMHASTYTIRLTAAADGMIFERVLQITLGSIVA